MTAKPIRTVTRTLLITALALTAMVRVASACPRSGWMYDPGEAPPCVVLSYETTHTLTVTNECTESLVLAAPGCPACSIPSVVAPGGVATLTLDEQPEDATMVDVDWVSGATSGTIAFEFQLNPCPPGDGCSAAPGTSGGPLWLMAAALGVAWLRARRRV